MIIEITYITAAKTRCFKLELFPQWKWCLLHCVQCILVRTELYNNNNNNTTDEPSTNPPSLDIQVMQESSKSLNSKMFTYLRNFRH